MVTWKKEKSAFVRLRLPPRPTQIGKVCDIFVYEKIFCHVTMCFENRWNPHEKSEGMSFTRVCGVLYYQTV